MDLAKLRYLESHEWADIQGDICTVGITQFAVDNLTDITHLELPKIGKAVVANQKFGEVESVKSVSELMAPVSGEVIEANAAVQKDPSLINQDPYGKGWMIRIKVAAATPMEQLLTFEQYEKQIAE